MNNKQTFEKTYLLYSGGVIGFAKDEVSQMTLFAVRIE